MRRRAGLLEAAVAAALVLLRCATASAGPWPAGALALELLPPGQPNLEPRGSGSLAFGPVAWTAEQLEGMRRRALLAAAAGAPLSLPLCEFNLRYRVVDLNGANFSSIVTLQNNRELSTLNWQLVWRYSDYRRVVLTQATGAIALSLGSPAGAPVRLVDTFTSDGISGGGGTYSFLADAALLGGPSSEQLLGIEAVNLNGMQCSEAGGGSMQYADCLAQELRDSNGSGGGSTGGSSGSGSAGDLFGGGTSSGDCWASFCCGVMLIESPAPASPPAPVPSPAVPDGPQPAESPAPSNGSEPQPLPPGPQPEGSSSEPRSSALVPAAAGGGGAAAVLLLAAGALLVWRRRRHRLQPADAAAASDSKASGRSMSTAGSIATGNDEAVFEGLELQQGQQAMQSMQRLPDSLPSGLATLSSILSPPSSSLLLRPGSSAAMLTAGEAGAASAAGSPGAPAPAGVQVTISPSVPGSAACIKAAPAGGSAAAAAASPSSCLAPPGEAASLAEEVVLQEQLGSGAFGTVFRGLWRGRPVAVKVLQTACGASSRELDSFRVEARVLSNLRHPHIVCLLAACTVPPNICIIEELAEGGSLHALLHGRPGARRRNPLPYARLLRLAADVAEAMCYLHPRIVHRDLKTQNILLDGQGRAKVCDFGIAKHKEKTFLSSAGGQAGTPAYMAPESFDNTPVTEKVDVFAFAVVCWEMFTGRVPWREVGGHMQIIFQVGILRQRPPLPDDCPPFLRQLIEECWAEEPAARPAFPAIRQRLLAELARVEADPAAAQACTSGECSASETEGSSAAGSLPGSRSSSSGSSSAGGGGGSGSGALQRASSGEAAPQPQPPAEPAASPFAACAAPFSSGSSSSGSDGGSSRSGGDGSSSGGSGSSLEAWQPEGSTQVPQASGAADSQASPFAACTVSLSNSSSSSSAGSDSGSEGSSSSTSRAAIR